MAKHPDCTLYRCEGCSHCFSDPTTVSGVEQYNERYYEEDHKQWFENPNFKYFARIADKIPKGGGYSKIIDVGCGRGDFLRYLARVRPELALTGIDVAAAESSDSIRFIRDDILSCDVQETFDAVVSLAVIEHIPDVKAFVRRLTRLSRPGGLVIVMTINESSTMYWLARSLRHIGFARAFDRLYSQHHVHHFTGRSLQKLLGSHEMTLVETFNHNGLLAATDIPASSALAAGILRVGVATIMVTGKVFDTMYLQTAVYRRNGTE